MTCSPEIRFLRKNTRDLGMTIGIVWIWEFLSRLISFKTWFIRSSLSQVNTIFLLILCVTPQSRRLVVLCSYPRVREREGDWADWLGDFCKNPTRCFINYSGLHCPANWFVAVFGGCCTDKIYTHFDNWNSSPNNHQKWGRRELTSYPYLIS